MAGAHCRVRIANGVRRDEKRRVVAAEHARYRALRPAVVDRLAPAPGHGHMELNASRRPTPANTRHLGPSIAQSTLVTSLLQRSRYPLGVQRVQQEQPAGRERRGHVCLGAAQMSKSQADGDRAAVPAGGAPPSAPRPSLDVRGGEGSGVVCACFVRSPTQAVAPPPRESTHSPRRGCQGGGRSSREPSRWSR